MLIVLQSSVFVQLVLLWVLDWDAYSLAEQGTVLLSSLD